MPAKQSILHIITRSHYTDTAALKEARRDKQVYGGPSTPYIIFLYFEIFP